MSSDEINPRFRVWWGVSSPHPDNSVLQMLGRLQLSQIECPLFRKALCWECSAWIILVSLSTPYLLSAKWSRIKPHFLQGSINWGLQNSTELSKYKIRSHQTKTSSVIQKTFLISRHVDRTGMSTSSLKKRQNGLPFHLSCPSLQHFILLSVLPIEGEENQPLSSQVAYSPLRQERNEEIWLPLIL